MLSTVRQVVPIRIHAGFEMPTVPLVLTRILQILEDDSASARELEALILHDPSLAARILKLANSAFYSFRGEVKTISRAIPLLGIKVVKSLAIGVSIFDSFTRGIKNEAELISRLWMHSFGVGILTQEIWSTRSNRNEAQFAFLCGLLHDLGKAVYFKTDPIQYSRIFSSNKSESVRDIRALESKYYGQDHAMMGAVLAEHWRLPPDLAAVIRNHHRPDRSGTPMVSVVAIADSLAKEAKIGYDGDSKLPSNLPALQARIAMSAEEYDRLKQVAADKRTDVEQFFQVWD